MKLCFSLLLRITASDRSNNIFVSIGLKHASLPPAISVFLSLGML